MTGDDHRTAESSGTTRRTVLASLAASGLAAGASGLALGATETATPAPNVDLEPLSVGDGNRLVDESGDPRVLRGVSMRDPRRLSVSQTVRGKTPEQVVDMLTDDTKGWYPTVVRVPASPVDIGKYPMGGAGPTFDQDHPGVQDGDFSADRRKQQPPQPPAFTEEQLRTYLTEQYDDVVQRCKDRGVYCVVDFHRQWHTQPPGDGQNSPYWENVEGQAEAENHLPYDSEYTNYWARNTYYGDEGRDVPASWGWVQQKWRNEADEPFFDGKADFEDEKSQTPYDKWTVNQPLVEEAKLFWRVVAERYGDEPHVLFEAYNEPTAPGIWGPARGGCEWYVQEPLWETFRTEFARPIVETIRDHSDRLVLMGLPGWSQGTQGLHWSDFQDENLAVTWHNRGTRAVSEETNWLNDAEYGSDPCNGWEPHEAQGLQNVQAIRPVVVTQWGWYSRPRDYDPIGWCNPYCVRPGTNVEAYGNPFVEALESDDRISWVADAADVYGEYAFLERDFEFSEPALDLPNDNWYEVEEGQMPVLCESLPCAWTTRPAPEAGDFVKSKLDELGGTPVSTPTATEPTWPTDPAPTDPDDDGDYEDLTGNGEIDNQDLITYFQNMGTTDEASPMAQDGNLQYYDYSDNGEIDYQDLIALFEEIA